jgi:hypothetical protein
MGILVARVPEREGERHCTPPASYPGYGNNLVSEIVAFVSSHRAVAFLDAPARIPLSSPFLCLRLSSRWKMECRGEV